MSCACKKANGAAGIGQPAAKPKAVPTAGVGKVGAVGQGGKAVKPYVFRLKRTVRLWEIARLYLISPFLLLRRAPSPSAEIGIAAAFAAANAIPIKDRVGQTVILSGTLLRVPADLADIEPPKWLERRYRRAMPPLAVRRGIGVSSPPVGYVVRPSDTPMKIAFRYTGDPERYAELVAANPALPRADVGAGRPPTFAKIEETQVLALPSGWPKVSERRPKAARGGLLGAGATVGPGGACEWSWECDEDWECVNGQCLLPGGYVVPPDPNDPAPPGGHCGTDYDCQSIGPGYTCVNGACEIAPCNVEDKCNPASGCYAGDAYAKAYCGGPVSQGCAVEGQKDVGYGCCEGLGKDAQGICTKSAEPPPPPPPEEHGCKVPAEYYDEAKKRCVMQCPPDKHEEGGKCMPNTPPTPPPPAACATEGKAPDPSAGCCPGLEPKDGKCAPKAEPAAGGGGIGLFLGALAVAAAVTVGVVASKKKGKGAAARA